MSFYKNKYSNLLNDKIKKEPFENRLITFGKYKDKNITWGEVAKTVDGCKYLIYLLDRLNEQPEKNKNLIFNIDTLLTNLKK